MSLLETIRAFLGSTPPYATIRDALQARADVTLAAPGLVRPLLTAALFAEQPRPTLVVVAGEANAERYARQVAAFLGPELVMRFSARVAHPWGGHASDVGVVGSRARALHALSNGAKVVVVASTRAVMRALPPQGSHVFDPLVLERGAQIDLTEALEHLIRAGYARGDAASEPGMFAVRGGVLDVYPSDALAPVRVELFGDEIESVRTFLPSTGQSIGDAPRTEVFGCREVALGSRAAAAARKALSARAARTREVAEHLSMIEGGIYFDGIERYLPIFYKRTGVLTDFLASEVLVTLAEPRSLFDDATRYVEEFTAAASSAGVDPAGLVLSPARLDVGGERQRLTMLALVRADGVIDAEITANRPDVAGGEERFVRGVRELVRAGYSVTLAASDRRARERMSQVLTRFAVPFVDAAREPGSRVRTGAVNIDDVDVPAGFVVPAARLAVVSIADAYPYRMIESRSRAVDVTRTTFSFAPGDHVVHVKHGVALFRKIERKEVLGSARDYLVLEYAKSDRLYVPVDQIDRITKYVGAEGGAPRVTRLDTLEWSRSTARARQAARALAFDLVDLYARRSAVKGRAFSPDTPWQHEMEAAFPYEESPDQLAAIADVKADMESHRPMDRLICGDVGYGKTEVALRAAFKAVQDETQVIVLCPTTVLAQQHYTTFSERFAPYPLRVEVLSRFRTEAQQAEVLKDFAAGGVDVLVGTHRLLSADVTPKSLGLVVVDEEQRFGVEHKEHLKHLREQVDVLTLSATPIPRTLQMALSGVRDMSVIDTPPASRFPVKVHVGEWDPDVASGAIRRELARGGQVYYISNRVRSIDEAVARVRQVAPEARVAVAHGQLRAKALESIMESFAAHEIDVLIATTIIENGIDNPHSNTLIIEDAQRLGLAQLYQIKGRVGRSHVHAFAFMFFPRGAILTPQAVERLTAIREHAGLGSGFKIALRDLEIRGAGSLLGAEQHGNLAMVGFDLYAEMIREAVAEARGEPIAERSEVNIDVPLSAFIPEEYVPDVDERIRVYRRLANAVTPDEIDAIAESLGDSRGPAPEPVRRLVAVARVRTMAAQAGLRRVAFERGRLVVGPVSLTPERSQRLAAMGGVYSGRTRTVAVSIGDGASVTDRAEEVIGAILTGLSIPPDPVEDR